jgi:hypothetical protein
VGAWRLQERPPPAEEQRMTTTAPRRAGMPRPPAGVRAAGVRRPVAARGRGRRVAWTVGVALPAAAVLALQLPGRSPSLAAWLLLPLVAVAVAAAQRWPVALPVAGRTLRLGMVDGIIAAFLLAGAGACVVPGALLGALLARRAHPELRRRAGTGIAARAIGAAWAVVVADRVDAVLTPGAWPGTSVVGAAVGALAGALAVHLLVSAAVATTAARRVLRVAGAAFPTWCVGAGAGISVGALVGYLAVASPWGLLGLAVPTIAVVSSRGESARLATEQHMFSEFVLARQVWTARTLDDVARDVVTTAARLLGGADVFLLVVGEQGATRYEGDEFGLTHRTVMGGAAQGDEWALRALRTGAVTRRRDGGLAGSEAGRPVLAVPLGAAEARVGAFVARRPVGSARFRAEDLRLAASLGRLAGVLLLAAGVLPWDASARASDPEDAARWAASRHAELREATARLAREAAAWASDAEVGEPGFTSRFEDLTQELLAVQQAVACLLGTTDEPSAGPGRRASDAVIPAQRVAREDDWTSTGVLR